MPLIASVCVVIQSLVCVIHVMYVIVSVATIYVICIACHSLKLGSLLKKKKSDQVMQGEGRSNFRILVALY